MAELQEVVSDEINYQKAMWKSDYTDALYYSEKVIGKLLSDELKGYRALWHYLGGNCAYFNALYSSGNESYMQKARDHYSTSKKATTGIPWLVNLSKYQPTKVVEEYEDKDIILNQIENIEKNFVRLGTLHDRKYAQKESEILSGLESNQTFENAHKELGNILGFDSYKVENDASPDPYWIIENLCIVFEDHAGADENSALSANKARQVSSHPDWIIKNTDLDDTAIIISVLITPVKKVSIGGESFTKNFSYWELKEFKKWAHNALSILREMRKSFVEAGDLSWRSEAVNILEKNHLDMMSLINHFKDNVASKYLDV